MNVTTAPHWFGALDTAIGAGQIATGSSMSSTVTTNEQVPVLLQVSVAEQFTVVLPTGKILPLAGVQVTAAGPLQASVAVGA